MVPVHIMDENADQRYGKRRGDMVRDIHGYDPDDLFDELNDPTRFLWASADAVFEASFRLTDWHRGRSAAYFELERLGTGRERPPRYYLNMEYIVEFVRRVEGGMAHGWWSFSKSGSSISLKPVAEPEKP
jgi:hypothetical protein